ncbi:MAG: VanZ family protein [Deltaproteobacteria bacterium]|nr:VanZ family protein [Deltaproteobacteria bacterium]
MLKFIDKYLLSVFFFLQVPVVSGLIFFYNLKHPVYLQILVLLVFMGIVSLVKYDFGIPTGFRRFFGVAGYFLIISILSNASISGVSGLKGNYFHPLEFGALGFLIIRSFFISYQKWTVSIVFTVLSGVSLGILDEIHQYFVPGRTADSFDVFLDFTGITAGILVFLFWRFLLVSLNSVSDQNLSV